MPPFNNVYFLGAKPNQLTSVIHTPDGDGYVATGNFEGATLLELSSTGTLSWARITSLSPEQASPQCLLALNRGHWEIEDRLHWCVT